MDNTSVAEREELEVLCEEWEYWNNQMSEYDTYGDNAFEGE